MSKQLKCKKHPNVKIIVLCPACVGGIRTAKKAASSRINGKLGGRPREER